MERASPPVIPPLPARIPEGEEEEKEGTGEGEEGDTGTDELVLVEEAER